MARFFAGFPTGTIKEITKMEFGINKWSTICELKKLGLRSRLAEFTALQTLEGFMT